MKKCECCHASMLSFYPTACLENITTDKALCKGGCLVLLMEIGETYIIMNATP